MRPVTVPPELLDGLVQRLDPVEVWLFGSRARGDARPDSDWDIYVVVDDAAEAGAWEAGIQEAGRYAQRADVGVDVVVRPWSRSVARRRALGTLDETIDHEGVRLYARADVPAVLDVPFVNSLQEWLVSGRKDLKAAKLVLDADLPDGAAFLVQQAWEKAIKGFRTLQGLRSPKSHDLEQLAAELQQALRSHVAFETISKWAIEGRYEGEDIGVPQAADVRAAIPDAEAALDRLEAAIRAI